MNRLLLRYDRAVRSMSRRAFFLALVRAAAVVVAAYALLFLGGFVELLLHYPVAWWLYLSVVLVFAAGLVRRRPVRAQLGRLGAVAAVVAVAATLYLVPWTTRKPFLRDLASVQIGMTEAEVRQVMAGYLEGTGWPASPFGTSDGSPAGARGRLTDLGSGSRYATAATESGELAIEISLVFRHSDDGAFNADWGIVSFADGRVMNVEFSPD